MSGMGIGDLFRRGHLAEALAAAGSVVKRAPNDVGTRLLLAELLLFWASSSGRTRSWRRSRRSTRILP